MDNIKNKLISDKNNTYFSNNKIIAGTEIPIEGTYTKGDLVVNIGDNNENIPIWICIEGGSPGVWGPVSKELDTIDGDMIIDGSISLIKLADDVKDAIASAGSVDLTKYATKEEFNNMNSQLNVDLDMKQDKNDDNLQTTDKTIVGAINELFQSANNGKELIANAIGEPISNEDTFSAMSEKIDTLTETFRGNLIECGVSVNSEDKLKTLIDKLHDIIRIVGGVGLRFSEGTALNMSTTGSQPTAKQTISHNMRFIPTYIFVNIGQAYTLNLNTNVIVSNLNVTEINNHTYVSVVKVDNLTASTFDISVTDDQGCNLSGLTWYAIGVGEEDTTVRDLLVEILVKEGVSVSDDDNILVLLEKIANELNKQVVPAGTAVENNVLSGKTFINSTGNLITGKMTNQGNKTVTAGTTVQTLPAGYYNSITINPGVASAVQYATGSVAISETLTYIENVISMNLDFTPNFIVATITTVSRVCDACNDHVTNFNVTNTTNTRFFCDWNGDTITARIHNISSSSFTLIAEINSDDIPILLDGTLTWHAFKV